HRRVSDAREALKAASDSSLDKFFLWRSVRDDSGKVVDFVLQEVNARGAKFLGRDRASAIGHRLSHVPVAMTGRGIDRYVHVVDTGEPLEEEFQVEADEVRPRWYRHQVVRVNDGIAITLRDITARKRSEQEVQLQKNFLQTLVDNIPVGVLVRRMKGADRGRIMLINETCAYIDDVN